MTNFQVGDWVKVLNPFRLPAVEDVRMVGQIQRITHQSSDGEPLYWINGRATACTARVLRLAEAR